jgi:hypothetical protein
MKKYLSDEHELADLRSGRKRLRLAMWANVIGCSVQLSGLVYCSWTYSHRMSHLEQLTRQADSLARYWKGREVASGTGFHVYAPAGQPLQVLAVDSIKLPGATLSIDQMIELPWH